jgi:sigma-B regulation protein RsbU (phosphoserine phosphatase)
VGESHRGLPLNAVRDHQYRSITIPLLPDELVLFYTDGLEDARNSRSERFGRDRVKKVFQESPSDAGRAGNLMLQAIDKFVAGHSQTDDMALVCFGRTSSD